MRVIFLGLDLLGEYFTIFHHHLRDNIFGSLFPFASKIEHIQGFEWKVYQTSYSAIVFNGCGVNKNTWCTVKKRVGYSENKGYPFCYTLLN